MDILIVISILIWLALAGFIWVLIIRKKSDFKRSLNMTFLRVLIPKKESDLDEKKETIHDFKWQISLMEQLLASLKALQSSWWKTKLFWQDYLSFEYLAAEKEIHFYMVVPKKVKNLVEKQVTSYYPDAIVDEVQEYNVFKDKKIIKAAELKLKKEYYLPIKTYQKLESDPINNITNAFSKLWQNETSVVQILLKPIEDKWQEKVNKVQKDLKKAFKWFSLNPLRWLTWLIDLFSIKDEKNKGWEKKEDEQEKEQLMKEKGKKTWYEVVIRVLATWDDAFVVEAQLKNMITAFSQFSSPGFNAIVKNKKKPEATVIHDFIFRYFKPVFYQSKRMILNSEEISSIFHFPHSKYNKTPEIKWQTYKLVKAPVWLAQEWITIGFNYFRWVKTEIKLANEDRFRHFYIIWQTGTGKSSLFQSMARQDLKSGKWLAIMDPHGDLANAIMPYIPRDRADDVIYFNPSDLSRPMWLNLLEANSEDEKQTVAQDSMNIMLKLFWNEIFWPRIQDYFRNWVLTLMDYPGWGALTDLIRLFTDDDFQKERVNTIKNPIVKWWWNYTFAKMWEREKWEMIPFWAAKFWGFVTNTMMRNIIWQVKSSFDVYDAMQTSKILLINLSKWVLWDVNANLLWLILVSKIQIAAMRRQLIEDQKERKDFFLYIDEFQNFITDSMESILSEARKYRLWMIMAHQYTGQLTKSDALTKSNTNLKDAIFWNVWSMFSFKIWPEDAEILSKQFAPQFSDQDLINLDKFKWVAKISNEWVSTNAFSMNILNPYIESDRAYFWTPDHNLAKAYKELSRLKYWREREFVEKEIIFRIWWN
ncbi:MAG: hypothetical protein ACD_2C00182G0010 [uncultured bacterium (gcode 4)]|uniref:DUF8128 domain-containing protein n=1 Tax=uncultured bacterium (gcode 4) TaxID=1234023 RepID=K2H0P6_9BACT|nr:MAG: hypothetical protein ACD_2C00182G0010 [uncultured bacterium (gcode 4)]